MYYGSIPKKDVERRNMKYTWVDEYLLDKTGVTKDLKEEWNWIRYQIGGKMFSAICLDDNDEPYYITLKLEPSEGDFLRQQYEDIIPGYYMNKTHWNSIKPDGAVPDDLLKDLLDKSYQLVLGGFSKKKQKEILEAAQVTSDLSCCGTDCSKCEYLGNLCKGCNACKGKVFHAPEGEACPIYECAINQKGLRGCGVCEHVPCEIWRKNKDPSMTEKEFERSIQERVDRLKKICK